MTDLLIRPWSDKGDDVRVGNLLVQGKLIFSPPQPGPAVGVRTPPFVYTATGAENPAGFPVVFPTGARLGAPYVAFVQYASGAVDFALASAPPGSYADDRIVVKTSVQLAAGDKLAVIIGDS